MALATLTALLAASPTRSTSRPIDCVEVARRLDVILEDLRLTGASNVSP